MELSKISSSKPCDRAEKTLCSSSLYLLNRFFQSSELSVNPVDSSTFVRQKTKALDTINDDDIIVETVEDEETDMAAMDYEQLMSYFESLKESSA